MCWLAGNTLPPSTSTPIAVKIMLKDNDSRAQPLHPRGADIVDSGDVHSSSVESCVTSL